MSSCPTSGSSPKPESCFFTPPKLVFPRIIPTKQVFALKARKSPDFGLYGEGQGLFNHSLNPFGAAWTRYGEGLGLYGTIRMLNEAICALFGGEKHCTERPECSTEQLECCTDQANAVFARDARMEECANKTECLHQVEVITPWSAGASQKCATKSFRSRTFGCLT